MSKSMSEQMQKLAARYEKATGKKFCGKTNAQKIRAMSDEELAEHFSELIKDTYENEYCKDVNDWLNWLQLEVEE